MGMNEINSQLQQVFAAYEYLWSLTAYRYLVLAWVAMGFIVGLVPMMMAFRKGNRAAGIQSMAASLFTALFSPILLIVITPLSIAMIRSLQPKAGSETSEALAKETE